MKELRVAPDGYNKVSACMLSSESGTYKTVKALASRSKSLKRAKVVPSSLGSVRWRLRGVWYPAAAWVEVK